MTSNTSLPFETNPGVGRPEIRETSHEPSGSGDERNRQRNLGDDHRFKRAMSGAAAGRRAPALVDQRLQARASKTKRRGEPDEERGRHERRERKPHDARIEERHAVQAREFRRAKGEQHTDADVCDRQPSHGAGRRQHQRFSEQLTHDTSPAGAKRDAHGDFARTHAAAREHEIRDVDRGQEKQQHRSGEDHHQRRAEIANHGRDERPKFVPPVLAKHPVIVGDARHGAGHFALQPLEMRAWFDPDEAIETVAC